jgi:hypothetical protein
LKKTYAAVAAKVSNGLATVVYDTRPKKRSIKAVMVPSFALAPFKFGRIHIGTISITVPIVMTIMVINRSIFLSDP